MLDYDVIYSKRRTISLSIGKDGRPLLRAPKGTKKARLEEILIKHADWIQKHREIALKRARADASLTEEQVAALKKAAKERLIPLTAHYARILGVSYGKITITSAKTRFGSCSSRGNIAYSYRLMRFPAEAQEYVVVHELCHRLYMDHSAAFYKRIEGVLPDYKARRALLKRIPE